MRHVVPSLGISLDGYIARHIWMMGGGFPQREFELVENRTYSKGLVALRYQRLRP